MNQINAILAKETLSAEDIDYLMANVGSIPQKGLERLGLATPTPNLVVKEPDNNADIGEAPVGGNGVPPVLKPEPKPKASKPATKAKVVSKKK